MCEFKKGDKVICIKTDNHPELIKNKIYEVEKPNGDFVYLKGCKYGYFTFLFRKECEYCKNDGYYKVNKSLISKTLKNNVDIDLSINVKDKKIVASLENLAIVYITTHQSKHNKGKIISERQKEILKQNNHKRKGIKRGIVKKNVSYKKIWKLHQKGYSINKISKELDYDWQQVKIRINEIYDNPELLEKGE